MLSPITRAGSVNVEANGDDFWSRHNLAALWSIVAVGALLRLVALGHKGFWLDEIASVSIAQRPSAAFWRFLWHDEGNMALYYVLLRPWLHFGHGEAMVRLLSVLPGVLAIPLMYGLARRLFGLPAGILAAALLALNPCAIASSQEARAYSFLVLGVIGSAYLFVRLIEAPSYRFAFAYAIVAGLTCYFHYFGVLVPATHAIALMVVPRSSRRWRPYLAAAAIFVLLAIPVLWLMHAQDIGHISWVQPPSLLELYHLGVFLAASGGKAVGAVLLALDLTLIGFFLTRMRETFRAASPVSSAKGLPLAGTDSIGWHYALVASSVFSPIVIALVVSTVTPVFYHRYLVICLPGFVLMTAVGALQIPHRQWRTSAIAGVCGLSLVSTVILYKRVTEDWRGAVGYLIATAHPEDRLLCYQPVGSFAVENYLAWLPGGRGVQLPVAVADPAKTNWEQQLHRAPRVWLVLYRAKVDGSDSRIIEQELLKSYNAGVPKVFRGIAVLEYDAKR